LLLRASWASIPRRELAREYIPASGFSLLTRHSDIHACLDLLSSMNTRWYTVKNCHKTLTLLLGNIQSRKASTNGLLAVQKADHPSPTAGIDGNTASDRPPKRRRTETNLPKVQMSTSAGTNGLRRASTSKEDRDVNMEAVSPTQMTDGTPGNTASGMSSPAVPTSNANSAKERAAAGLATSKQRRHTPSGWSNSSIDASANPTTLYDLSAFINPSQTAFRRSDTNTSTDQASGGGSMFPFSSGSALYSTQQEMAFAQNSMQLPELPSMNTTAGGGVMPGMMEDPDPMFWGNMDYNLADVFGSATWEQMTAPTPRSSGVSGQQWDSKGV
jgi:hypothetical protein